jgi:mitochondrial fission protein ELM1
MSEPLKLLLLRDKKPGHYHQVEGIAHALELAGPVSVSRIDVRPKWFAHDDVRKFVARHFAGGDPGVWLRRLYGIGREDIGSPDLVIASGRPTILAAIYIARMTGAKFVYSGRATGYPYDDIALMLVAFPRHDGEFKQVYAPIPCLVDWRNFPPAGSLATREDVDGKVFSLFIGGPSFSHDFDEVEWNRILGLIGDLHAEHGVRWWVSTSRRTPDALGDRLANLLRAGVIETFVDYRKAGAGSAGALYGADAIIVTEDSLTMISEALAARRRVLALKPAKVKMSLNDEMVAGLIGEGSLAVLPISSLTSERFISRLLKLRDPVADIHADVASIILGETGLDRR